MRTRGGGTGRSRGEIQRRSPRKKGQNGEFRDKAALRRPHPEGARMHLVSRSGLSSSNNFALHFPGKDEVTILSLSPPLRKEAITEPPPKRTKPPFLPLAPKRHTRQFLAFRSPDEGKWETDGANRTAEGERGRIVVSCAAERRNEIEFILPHPLLLHVCAKQYLEVFFGSYIRTG